MSLIRYVIRFVLLILCMGKKLKATVIITSIVSTYILLGKFPYTEPQTLIGITEGADINVPYNHKYGIFEYAFAKNYYKNGEIIESRIESFDNLRFTFSIFSTIGVWGIAALIITNFFRGNKEIIDSGKI
ncbi:hypothetical protein [Calothrix sp. PCC 6303]|uniref:hypothetical protein n=1 Tax=Calothrix sp. PCC 6303 TaxID=1170562 RepID=UPI0002A019DA|nr:hypothetical protein [Calothrix sp. PCC 6303]AFY99863.1 hypothetical protein Cal6303_0797 [Calothrix sp. PCC 6303]